MRPRQKRNRRQVPRDPRARARRWQILERALTDGEWNMFAAYLQASGEEALAAAAAIRAGRRQEGFQHVAGKRSEAAGQGVAVFVIRIAMNLGFGRDEALAIARKSVEEALLLGGAKKLAAPAGRTIVER